MTITAVYRDGHFVPKEPLDLEEGMEVSIPIPILEARSETGAVDRFFDRMAELSKGANPHFVWNRDLAYDFDDE